MSPEFTSSTAPEDPNSPERISNNRIAVVTGVTSSGKDYLLKKVFEDGFLAEVGHFGMGTLIGEYHSMNRDEMLGVLRPDQIQAGQVYALNKILDNTPAVVSTHIAALYEGEYVIGKELEMGMNAAHYIMVTAEPKQIRKWRKERNKEKGRNSLVESEEEIDFHQNLLWAITKAIADQHGAEFTFVYNTPEDTEENVNDMREIIESII